MMLSMEEVKRITQGYTPEEMRELRENYGAEVVTPSGSINYEALYHAYSLTRP